jgi:dienelactone hydrolase
MRALKIAIAALTLSAAASAQERSDEWLRKPVNARTFETYRSFFAYDRRPTFDARTIDTSLVDGVFIEHLSFESTPGNRVYANLFEPAGQRGANLRTLIMLHGGVARGKDNVRVMADFMAKSGWRVLAIDMPYFGERKTDLLEAFTEAEKHEKLYNSQSTYLAWVTQVAKDVGRSIDFLVRERATDSTRIALVGYSRGGQVGSIVGGVEKRFRAVALLYAGHFDAKETGHHPAACPANYIGRIAPRPLFLLNGTQDADYFRADQVEPLHRIAKNPKRIMWVETGHVFPPEETRPVLARWLAEQVR